jgi:hypothetical protein
MFSPTIRQWMIDDAKGKVIEKLEFVDDGPCGSYWVVSFTDGSEMCIRFMSEVVDRQQFAAEARTRVAES